MVTRVPAAAERRGKPGVGDRRADAVAVRGAGDVARRGRRPRHTGSLPITTAAGRRARGNEAAPRRSASLRPSSAARPTKSPLSMRTAKPSPASYGSCSVVMSMPHEPVALLQPQAVERAAARRDTPSGSPAAHSVVPQLAAHVGGRVQLPAELADVGHAQRGDRHVPEVGLAGLEVAERLVRDSRCRSAAATRSRASGPHTPMQQVPAVMSRTGPTPPSSGACRAASPGRGCRWRRPGTRSAAEPGHGQVGADAAVASSSMGVDDRPDRPSTLLVVSPLQEGERRRGR